MGIPDDNKFQLRSILIVAKSTQLYLKIFSSKLGRHRELLPAPPLPALAKLGRHGRVVGHLFRDGTPPQILGSVALEGLAQQRIEGFTRPGCRGRVTRYRESCNKGHFLETVGTLRSSVQNLGVLKVLGESL